LERGDENLGEHIDVAVAGIQLAGTQTKTQAPSTHASTHGVRSPVISSTSGDRSLRCSASTGTGTLQRQSAHDRRSLTRPWVIEQSEQWAVRRSLPQP
jgi:hypothetical protein